MTIEKLDFKLRPRPQFPFDADYEMAQGFQDKINELITTINEIQSDLRLLKDGIIFPVPKEPSEEYKRRIFHESQSNGVKSND